LRREHLVTPTAGALCSVTALTRPRKPALRLRFGTRRARSAEPASADIAGTPASTTGKLAASTSVFWLGSTLTRALTFLLLPLYTRALSPASYGILSVLLVVTSAAGIVLSFGLDVGVFRSYYVARAAEDQHRFIQSAWRFLVVAPLVGALVLTLCALPFIGSWHHVDTADVFLALVGAALFAGFSVVPLAITRIELRLRTYLTLTVIDALSTTVATVLLVVVLHLGVTGWLVGVVISYAVDLVVAMWLIPWDRSQRTDWRQLGRAIRVSVMFMPNTLLMWALLLADRIVLATLVPASSLGVHSLAANLAVPVNVAVVALNQALMPSYARAGTDPTERAQLDKLVPAQVTVVVLLCLAAALLGSPVTGIVAPHSYASAGPLVAWIALGYGFLGLYCVPMNGATLGAGRGGMVWVTSALAATTNIGLLFWLVPSGGIRAAAIASAAGYLVLLAAIGVYARGPDNPVRYDWPKLGGAIVAGVAIYVGALATTPATGLVSLFGRLGWILVFALGAAAALRMTPRAQPS